MISFVRHGAATWALLAILSGVYLTNVAVVSQRAIARATEAVAPVSGDPGSSVRTHSQAALGPVFLDEDSVMWLVHSENAVREREFRVRTTYADNTPFGREVHWSSLPIWFIRCVGQWHSWFSAQALHGSMAVAAEWWNPTVHWLIVLLVSACVMRAWGRMPGLLAGATYATLPALHFTCHTARPDHHGLQALFALMSILLPILGGLGWTRAPSQSLANSVKVASAARRWMIAGGLAAAAGLWIGAIVQIVVLAGFFFGLCLWLAFDFASASAEESDRYDPNLWRWWGWSAAAASLLFYLIEYFPAHMQLRLEVNNPWFALCLAAAGEILCRLTRMKFLRSRWNSEAIAIACAASVLLSPALALVLGPPEWYALKDPWLLRMHNGILEFQNYETTFPGIALRVFFISFGILPFFFGIAIYAFSKFAVSSEQRGALAVTTVVSACLLVCLLIQERWTILFAVTVVLLAVAVSHVTTGRPAAFWCCSGVLVAQVLCHGVMVAHTALSFGGGQIDPAFAATVASRDVAAQLGRLRGPNQWRVLCEPTDVPFFAYYAGVPGVASFYWENGEGLRDAALFMTDQNDTVARQIAYRRGLTHIFVNESPETAKFYQNVRFGEADLEQAKTSLAGRLARRKPPEWLRLDEQLTAVTQQIYRAGQRFLNGKLLVYDVSQE